MNDDLNEEDFIEMFYGIENDDLIHVCGGPGELVRCVDCAKLVGHWNYNYIGYFMCDDCIAIEGKLEMNIKRSLDEYDENWNWRGYDL